MAAPGASALAIDEDTKRLLIGYTDGRIATLDLALVGDGGVSTGLVPAELARADHPVTHLFVTTDSRLVVAASGERLTSVELAGGKPVGSLDLAGIADLAPGGNGSALVADIDDVDDRAAVASSLADILGGTAADYQARLDGASPGTTVVLGTPGSGEARTALDAAIADGTLEGVRVDTVDRVAVATADGVAFVDPERVSLITTITLAGGAHGLALVTGVDEDRVYATTGTADDPHYDVIAVGGDAAKDGPVDKGHPGLGLNPLPGLGSLIAYDEASQMVHILGRAPGAGAEGPWTVYVVEPHGNAVFADAQLPDGFVPSAWGADFNPDYPSEDRQQILVFAGDGASASIDTGSHAFAWRFPGVIAGGLTIGLLYLLGRILFRRRLVAGLVGLFVLFDGMFFVQSRIGMNDVYVGCSSWRPTRSSPRSGPAGGGGEPRSGSPCRSSASCSGWRSRASGSRPMPSGRCCCSSWSEARSVACCRSSGSSPSPASSAIWPSACRSGPARPPRPTPGSGTSPSCSS